MSDNVKIHRLSVSNFMAVEAVEIEFDKGVAIVSGPNGAGKSCVINSLSTLFMGKKATPSNAVKSGTKEALISAACSSSELGDFVVTKKIKESGNEYLTITTKIGAKYTSPQKLLDGFLDVLSFDPLAFSEMRPPQQRALLIKHFVDGIDLDALAEERKSYYSERTLLNKQMATERERLNIMPKPEEVEEVEEVDIQETLASLEAKRKNNRYRECQIQEMASLQSDINTFDKERKRLEEELKTLIESRKEATQSWLNVKSSLTEEEDVTDEEEKLSNAQAINRKAAEIRGQIKAHMKQAEVVEKLEKQRDFWSTSIEGVDLRKEQALKRSTIPVEGLTVTDDGVLYNGLPFEQECESGRIIIGVKIAAAINPTLKLIRIERGSALDSSNLKKLSKEIKELGFAGIIEVVKDTESGGIEITEG